MAKLSSPAKVQQPVAQLRTDLTMPQAVAQMRAAKKKLQMKGRKK
jgi:hypothetical protein